MSTPDARLITTRLLEHAGLTRTEPRVDDFWTALDALRRRNYCELDVDLLIAAVNDVLKCIDEFNRLGYADRLAVTPSKRLVSSSVAYAVGEIMRQLASALCDLLTFNTLEQVRITLTEAIDLITIAWSAFMAGDIEDVMTEVRASVGFRRRLVNWGMHENEST